MKTPDAAVQVCVSLAAHEEDAEPDAYDPLTLHCQQCVALAAGNAFLPEMLKTDVRKLLAFYRVRCGCAVAINVRRAIASLIVKRNSDAAKAVMQWHAQCDQVTAKGLLAAPS